MSGGREESAAAPLGLPGLVRSRSPAPGAPSGRRRRLSRAAVIAHPHGSLGRGLSALREMLAAEGIEDLLWYELDDIHFASAYARQAAEAGAEVVFVWGGDGTVQRAIDGLAGSSIPLAILPAGTGNLLAVNLGIPTDLTRAVALGLHGPRRRLDTGKANGECFAVAAGAGLDALIMRDADTGRKDRMGRAAYFVSGALNLDAPPVAATLTIDGVESFAGELSCVLVGNVSHLFAGIELFEGAQPDDGILECIVFTASNLLQWARTAGRVVLGATEDSPFTQTARGHRFAVRFERPFLYEIDGDPRGEVTSLDIEVQPGSITVCAP